MSSKVFHASVTTKSNNTLSCSEFDSEVYCCADIQACRATPKDSLLTGQATTHLEALVLIDSPDITQD